MKPHENTICLSNSDNDTEKWFDNLVATIRAHQVQIESGIADDVMKNMYAAFINHDLDKIHELSRESSSRYLISKMIFTFFDNFKKPGNLPIELALQLSNNGVNIWAIVDDYDENAEREIILSTAKTNAAFHDLGLRIDTTILEKSDNFPIPNQFQKVIFHA